MKTLVLLSAALLCLAGALHGDDANASSPSKDEKSKSAGSFATPIVVKGVKTKEELDAWIAKYIKEKYPTSEVTSEVGEVWSDVSIKIVRLENSQGEKNEVYFNITDYMAKQGKQNAKLINKLSNGKDSQKVASDVLPEGLTYHKPIVLKGATDSEKVEELQKEYLKSKYPGYEVIRKEIWFFDRKFIERLSLKKEDDELIINFDISDYMNEYKKTHQLKFEKMSEQVQRVEK